VRRHQPFQAPIGHDHLPKGDLGEWAQVIVLTRHSHLLARSAPEAEPEADGTHVPLVSADVTS